MDKITEPLVMVNGLFVDDRGFVYTALDNLNALGIKRTYVVENHRAGMIRAWHGHREADTFIHVLSGSLRVAAMNMDDHEEFKIVHMTDRTPKVMAIPRGWYNGTMSLTDNTKILVYSTLTLDEVKNDDHRLEWDVNKTIWEIKNR